MWKTWKVQYKRHATDQQREMKILATSRDEAVAWLHEVEGRTAIMLVAVEWGDRNEDHLRLEA